MRSDLTPPAVDVILFDIGNVLLPYDRQRRVDRLLALGAMADGIAALFASGLPEALDCGRAETSHLADALGLLLGRAVEPAEAMEIWTSVFWRDEAMWALLDDISPSVPLGAFSDNPAFVGALLPDRLDPRLVFFSSELGVTKPAPEAFAAVSERLGGAASVLFVDDVLANVEAARRHGWRALHFTSAAGLRGELAAIGGLLR